MVLMSRGFKKRTEAGISLIIKCLKKKPNVNSLNNLGYSIEDLINERDTDEMKKVMEEITNEERYRLRW